MNTPLVVWCYRDRFADMLPCYDRGVITGMLPGAGHAAVMTISLNAQRIRIFDYPGFAELLGERIQANAKSLAASAGAKIEHIAKVRMRNRDVVAAAIKTRGVRPGLEHIISNYRSRRGKCTGPTN